LFLARYSSVTSPYLEHEVPDLGMYPAGSETGKNESEKLQSREVRGVKQFPKCI
jgi:hypothetical protein